MKIIFIFIILFILSFVSLEIKEKAKLKIIFCFSIIISLYLFCSRNELTSDTQNYINIYNANYTYENIEYLYLFLNTLFKNIGLNFYTFLFIVNLTICLIWYKCTKIVFSSYRILLLAWFVYFSFFGIYFNAIILRAAIGSILSYVALSFLINYIGWRKYLYYFVFILIAAQFHSSMALWIIFPWIIKRNYSRNFLIGLCTIVFLLPLLREHISFIRIFIMFLFENNLVDNRFSFYMNENLQSLRSGLYGNTEILYFMTTLFLISIKDKISWTRHIQSIYYNVFLNVNIIGLALLMVVAALDIPMGLRIAYNFLYYQFIPLTLVLCSDFRKKRLYYCGLIIFSILNFYSLINNTHDLIYL